MFSTVRSLPSSTPCDNGQRPACQLSSILGAPPFARHPRVQRSVTVEIPKAGDYRLWVRAASGTGLSYKLDDAKEAVDVDIRAGQNAIYLVLQ